MFAKYVYINDELDESNVDKWWLRWRKIKRMKDVWDALAKLDGDRFSILIVAEKPGGPQSDYCYSGKAMCVAGGNDGQYQCNAYIVDEITATMLRNPRVSETTEYVPLKRGQLEEFPKHLVVGLNDLRKALVEFVKYGELSPDLTWEPERPLDEETERRLFEEQ